MAKGPRRTTRTPRASPRTVNVQTKTKKPGLIKRILNRYKKNKKARLKKKGTPKAKPGFAKKTAGAIADHALKDTGHLGKHITKMFEMDGAGHLGGTPVNNASSGTIAGLDTWAAGSQGEPGVKGGGSKGGSKTVDKSDNRDNRKKRQGVIAHIDGYKKIDPWLTKYLSEDGGVPVNNASSGAVAGLGTSKDGSQGEPGVNKKRKKAPLLTYQLFKRKSNDPAL